MDDMKKECQKSFYETLYTLKTPGQSVVIDRTTDKIYLKKILTDYNEFVYQYLHDHRNLHIPYVQFYYREADDLIVIEEYVSGNTLEEFSHRQNLSEKDRRKVLSGVLDAMEFLHNAEPPIIHRDIKPSNIMITDDGVVKLIDYDAAKISRPGESRDTELIGTVGSAAPEQYGFGASDERTDIYAFGVLLKTLFPQDENVLRVAKKCMRMDPEDRYQDVQELRKALQSAETEAKGKPDIPSGKICTGTSSQTAAKEQRRKQQDHSSGEGYEQKKNQRQVSGRKKRRILIPACVCACIIVALVLTVPQLTGLRHSGSAANSTATSDTQKASGTDEERKKNTSGSSAAEDSSGDEAESGADDQTPGETNTEKDTKNSKALKIKEKGYSVISDGVGRYVVAGIVYQNTSKTAAFEYPSFSITAYDKNGNVLGTSEMVQGTVEPEETQATYIQCECKENPDHVRFSCHSGNIIDADKNAIKASDLKISGQTKQNYDYGTKFSGEIKNTGKKDLESAAVVLILRKNGRIVYAMDNYMDNLNAGATKAYTFDVYDPPEFDSYSVYAYRWI